jgi:hypothetical protein
MVGWLGEGVHVLQSRTEGLPNLIRSIDSASSSLTRYLTEAFSSIGRVNSSIKSAETILKSGMLLDKSNIVNSFTANMYKDAGDDILSSSANSAGIILDSNITYELSNESIRSMLRSAIFQTKSLAVKNLSDSEDFLPIGSFAGALGTAMDMLPVIEERLRGAQIKEIKKDLSAIRRQIRGSERLTVWHIVIMDLGVPIFTFLIGILFYYFKQWSPGQPSWVGLSGWMGQFFH